MCENLSFFIILLPNGQGSSPIYRFLHDTQTLLMTEMHLGLLHCLETTNFGHNGNMLFLVLQANDLLEGLV